MSNALSNEEEDILWHALEIAVPDERKAFLDQACQERAILREKVDRMLAMQLEAEVFFLEAQSTCFKLLSSE